MKALRSSPLRVFAVASALQVVILFCWSVAAKLWEQSNKPIINKGARIVFMEFSPCRRTERCGIHPECSQALLHLPPAMEDHSAGDSLADGCSSRLLNAC
ncbi:hypothetical protein D3C73_478650 [compost metagenome]